MMYEVEVTIHNRPNTKVIKWGYLINAESKEQAKSQAISQAKEKANKPYSRYKKCFFTVEESDIVEKPDW